MAAGAEDDEEVGWGTAAARRGPIGAELEAREGLCEAKLRLERDPLAEPKEGPAMALVQRKESRTQNEIRRRTRTVAISVVANPILRCLSNPSTCIQFQILPTTSRIVRLRRPSDCSSTFLL